MHIDAGVEARVTAFSNEQRGEDAEGRARLLANEAGLRPSKPTPDLHGFDLYVQVPAAAEQLLFGTGAAVVQVKGTTGRRVSVELSVWKALIEVPLPAFFLVYWYPSKAKLEPTRAFLVHVDGALLEAAVERIWKSGGRSLAKQKMDLTWKAAHELAPVTAERFVAALHSSIGTPSEYASRKVETRQRAGHSARPITVVMRRSSANVDVEMAEFAVGLRRELRADRMEMFETRFGAKRPLPDKSAIDGATMSWPEEGPPMEAAEVRFINHRTGDETCVSARVAVSTRVFPWLTGPHVLIRIVHEVVEFVLGQAPRAVSVTVRLPERATKLRDIATAAGVLDLLESGGCDVELRLDGLPPHRVGLRGEITSARLPLEQRDLLEAGALAYDIARRVGLPDDLSLSHRALTAALDGIRRASLFVQNVNGLKVTIEGEVVATGAIVGVVWVHWMMLGADLVAVHGMFVGVPSTDADGRVRMENAQARLLIARRIPLPLGSAGADGFVEDAITKAEADPTIELLLGRDRARGAWAQTREKVRQDVPSRRRGRRS